MLRILADLAPLAVFFVAYQLGGMQTAVASLLAAAPLSLILLFAAGVRPTKLQLGTCAVVVILCSITLALRNPAFILAKPTVVYWSMGIGVGVATALGANPARALLAQAFSEADFGDDVWRRVALQWIAALFMLGGLNWLLAASISEQAWVAAKTFGFPAMLFVVLFTQIALLWRRSRPAGQ